MSTAVLSKSVRRNGKAISDGQQIDLPDDSPETVAMTASEREAVISDEMANDSPAPVVVRSIEELERDYRASLDDTAGMIGRFLTGTKLAVYCEIGRACRDHLALAKACVDARAAKAKVASDWGKDQYDLECGFLSLQVRNSFPEVVAAESKSADESGKKKRDPIQVTEYVQAYLTVEALRPVVGDVVDELSYLLIRNYIMRKMIILSKTDIMVKIRDGWNEFARIEIPRYVNGDITQSQFIAQLTVHADKMAGTGAKTAATMKAADKARKALVDSLAKAVELLDPVAVAKAISEACEGAKITLPGIGETVTIEKPIDPATITADELLETLQTMLVLRRRDEVRAIVEACAEMATIIPALAPNRPAAVAV